MEPIYSTSHLLYVTIVVTYYGYLLYLFGRGVWTTRPRTWWVVGGTLGFVIGALWAAVTSYLFLQSDNLWGPGIALIASDMPLALPLLVHFQPWPIGPWRLISRACLTVVATVLIGGTVFGYTGKGGRNNKLVALSVPFGIMLIWLITYFLAS